MLQLDIATAYIRHASVLLACAFIEEAFAALDLRQVGGVDLDEWTERLGQLGLSKPEEAELLFDLAVGAQGGWPHDATVEPSVTLKD
mmetsp:Transcript_16840/g.53808  ORF Transcript_16840/g.53808 Transcript_16840/m.53808 type:complete len:87 (-) Transcript_16840:74-334(-)